MKISEKVKMLVMAGALAIVGAGAALVPDTAYAAPSAINEGLNVTKNEFGNTNSNVTTIIQNIIHWILYAVGVLAVIMVIFGGVQYTTSAGDQAKVTKAKNTILYGLIGLVVAVLSYAIVDFVVSKIG